MADTRTTEQKAFEDYNKRKFKDWVKRTAGHETHVGDVGGGTEIVPDTRTEEQKAFEDYVKNVTAGKPIIVYESKALTNTFAGLKTNFLPAGKKTSWYKSTDANYVQGTRMIMLYHPTDKSSETVACFGTLSGLYEYESAFAFTSSGYYVTSEGLGGGGSVPEITASVLKTSTLPPNEQATASVQNVDGDLKFTFGIPKGEKGDTGASGGGGGGQADVPVVPPNKDYKTITGKFGLNLFDYRELSTDNDFSTHGKIMYLNQPKKLLSHTSDKDAVKKLRLYNRLREGDRSVVHNIHFKAKLLESSDRFGDGVGSNNDLGIRIFNHNIASGDPELLQEINFTNDTTHLTDKHPFTSLTKDYKGSYSYLKFDIGGIDHPAKGKIHFSAYYGDFEPEGLKQNFEFLKYNGVTLKKNWKGTADEYRHSTWYDSVSMKLGVFKLKNAQVVRVVDGTGNTKTITVKVPDDLWLPKTFYQEPTSSHTVDRNKVFDNLMSSNLCDITQNDGDRASAEDKPFFLRYVSQETDMRTGKIYNCFTILLGKENMSKWRYHLSETEILYPIKDPTDESFEQLPLGGLIFNLSSGQSIETNKFSHISNYQLDGGKTRFLKFSDSPFGYQDVLINVDQITSVVTNIVPDSHRPLP